MSREKMLQAEIALKDEQLADLNEAVERLRRQLEESEKRAKTTDQSESKIAELKQTIGKLAPVAKKATLFAGELDEARRRLAIAEKDRNKLSNDYSTMRGQSMVLKSALIEAQSDARSCETKRKNSARRAMKAEATAKRARQQKLMVIAVAALLCAATIGSGYSYVRSELTPPAELSDEAAAAFERHAPEYRELIEEATQNERDALNTERANLAAERNRYQELSGNTFWDNIAFYGWLALLFGGGFILGAIAVVGAFVSLTRFHG